MRVLQLCADAGIAPGSTKGAAQHLRGVAAGLSTLGHEVVTASARQPEGPFPVPVLDLSDGLALAAAGEVDVIYERYSLGHRAGLDVAVASGRPLVLEVNAPLVAEATTHRPGTVAANAATVEVELLRRADLVITVSKPLARWVDDHRHSTDRAALTLANGFQPTWFAKPAEPQNDGPLVFLGHPKPWHGAARLPWLLRALADRGHDPTLLIIGGGTGIDPIKAQAQALGVAGRIDITGPLPPEQATGLLTDGCLGLAPYHRQEPFYFCPLKVVDYLAAGLPVVSTDQGDIAELVRGAGVLVDPDDDAALVDAVAALLDDPWRRAELGRAGRTRAMAERTWLAVATATAAAIEAIGSTSLRHGARA